MLPFSRLFHTLLLSSLLLAPSLLSGCRTLLRYPGQEPVSPFRVEHTLETKMNARLLSAGLVDRLVVEIDWVEGCEPKPKAIKALRKAIAKYTVLGGNTEIILDDQIPGEEWKNQNDFDSTPLVKKYLDHVPNEPEGTEVLYLLYSPGSKGYFGIARWWTFERDGKVISVNGINIFTNALDQRSILWITRAKAERSTLVHEFGHTLGLVWNNNHVQAGNPLHCRNPQCVMTHPRARSIAYSFIPALFAGQIPKDYCKDCRTDIRRAKAIWEEKGTSEPQYVATLEASYVVNLIELEVLFWMSQDIPERAMDLLQENPELLRDNQNLAARIGWACRRSEQSEKVLAVLRELAGLDPSALIDGYIIGMLSDMGRYDEALKMTLDLGNEAGRNIRELARAYQGVGRIDEAIKVYEKFLPSDDKTRIHRFYQSIAPRLMELYLLDGRISVAQVLDRDAPAEIRSQLSWRVLLSLLAFSEGDHEQGREILEDGIQEAEKQLASRKGKKTRGYARQLLIQSLVQSYALLGEREKALESTGRNFRRRGEDASRIYTRAQAFAILGDTKASLDSLEEWKNANGWIEDVCLDHFLNQVREEPEFFELFPQCSGVPLMMIYDPELLASQVDKGQ